MKEVLSAFTTRDWAIIIWIIIFFIFILWNKQIRKMIIQLIHLIFNKYFIVIFTFMLVYIAGQVYVFNYIGLWKNVLVKDLIVWGFGFAVGSIININNVNKGKGYFFQVLKESLKLTLLLEFIINFYTFHILIELVFVPFMVLLYGMLGYSESDKKYLPVKKLLNFILNIIGLIIIIYVANALFTRYDELLTNENLLSFVLPIYLSITFIPFIYIIALYVLYEEIIVVAKHLLRNEKDLGSYFVIKLIKNCHFNLFKLIKFNTISRKYIVRAKNKEDLDKMINLKFEPNN